MTSESGGMLFKESVLSLKPGTVISGRYEIGRLLGHGPNSAVYLCRHLRASLRESSLIALKVLSIDRVRQPLALTRFDAEISLSSRVIHPNVVRTYDTIINYDMLAYTMEYVSGGSLADYIRSRGRLAINEVLSILKDVCSGLAAVHAEGIRHRDLKPANIMLQPTLQAKISDFGISSDRQYDAIIQDRRIVGTAAYISPEVVSCERATELSDIYSLGVTAYLMLTGRPPFKGESTWKTLSMRLHDEPEPLEALRQSCPPLLARIVEKAMAREPEERFASAELMRKALSMVEVKTARPAMRVHTESRTFIAPRTPVSTGSAMWN